MKMIFLTLLVLSLPLKAAIQPDSGVYMMPMNCSELLPDNAPFVNFFEAVALAAVEKDRAFAKRLLRVKALRERVSESVTRGKEQNPVDVIIRRSICFYREQKEPLKPVSFDDAGLMQFMKSSVKELEAKVEDAVFQTEFEKYQREEYERRVQRNFRALQSLEQEANREASFSYEKLSKAARKKVRIDE
jgi:hypothetical protein